MLEPWLGTTSMTWKRVWRSKVERYSSRSIASFLFMYLFLSLPNNCFNIFYLFVCQILTMQNVIIGQVVV